ncbi:Uncharacterised protein [Mycobacteroides abscessus subsp. abscessus]|uniref:hypothetical protein n=1 Tax=Mycobacteroides TaxID=670516 RepID=UPI000928F19A|nr:MULTISPECIES: hypothetical protein [Mycobacteroides]SIC79428.1 Uncharacterised protein [Mycobacteroides abscessus subsp. abscessus]SIE43907.1 Uncharacterised protein [Mycobacteroides abscessus subsp. abscessus]SIE73876.1 Uncharacterised protein [Mycobacteroides abscessus subsp. abscessus]SIF50826.1 Uncharacterised protein [Mycobacteroides abscessus subsp. abscessus]SIF86710.1 Uncharacterised protein [Mycobacteroides abscessus subsp. abscessus]
MTTQSRPGTTNLVALVIASVVGLSVVGCSHPTTPTGSSTISTTAPSRALVDVEKVWASHPMPDCPRVIIGNQPAPAGLELPSDETVAVQLRGVKSAGTESWVRAKLGWVTKWLAKVRADIIDADTTGDSSMTDGFSQYIQHIKSELAAGHDIPDSALDGDFPEGCA